jgi:hypothetical protein
MMFKRLGPSPAAPIGEGAAAGLEGGYEGIERVEGVGDYVERCRRRGSSSAATPPGCSSRTAVATSALRSTNSGTPRARRYSSSSGNTAHSTPELRDGDNLRRWVRRRVVSTWVRRFGRWGVGSTRRLPGAWLRRGRLSSTCAGGRIVRGRSRRRCGSRRTRFRDGSASSGARSPSFSPALDCARRRASVWRTG